MLQDTELMAGVRVGELLRSVHSRYPHPAELSAVVDLSGVGALMKRRTDRAGQAQRVRFALAAVGDPQLLILDEPTAAMDVQSRQAFWTALRRQTERGTTVLFSTHYLDEADAHADRILVIRSGRIVADGTPAQVKATAGTGRVVRFRLVRGRTDQFRALPGVLTIHTDGAGVVLHTSDADATVWALYPVRDAVADLRVSDARLEDAFIALTGCS